MIKNKKKKPKYLVEFINLFTLLIAYLKPSKKVGELKTAIEDAILDGIIPNTYEDALEYLYKIKDQY